VFLLWGKYAQDKQSLIDLTKHAVLKAAHPSPFSANNGFFGCRHFSKTNELLIQNGKEAIDWEL
jgi:uracil-DNA glycosylase